MRTFVLSAKAGKRGVVHVHVCLEARSSKLDTIVDGKTHAADHRDDDIVASYITSRPEEHTSHPQYQPLPSEVATFVISIDSSKRLSGGMFGGIFIPNLVLVKRLEQGVAAASNFDMNVKTLSESREEVDKGPDGRYSECRFAAEVKL